MHPENDLFHNNVSDSGKLRGDGSRTARYLTMTNNAILSSFSATQSNRNQQSNNQQSNGERQWRALDFGDIEKSLASKLTDGYVNAILRCVGAVRNVKTLKLTGCVNITGSGLEPLRGSSVLEQLADLARGY